VEFENMPNQNIENQPLLAITAQGKEEEKVEKAKKELAIADLGWSEEEARETYYRLLTFKEDWEAPGMEAYDDKYSASESFV
jgi:hypothetical protein